MARSREVVYLKDFTGGLNLTDPIGGGLADNESPDCLNVDFGYKGGFVTRGGFRTQVYSTLLDGARIVGQTNYGSDEVLIVGANGELLSWNGSAITNESEDLSDTTIAANPIQAATFDSKTYFANGRSGGNIIMQSWDGTTRTTLTNTFNDDYNAPDGGDMPLARQIAVHNGYMWVADTVESATRYHHRVRFSHVQQPEDWATDDYFDIDPSDDGDQITALVPFRDRLMVFKRSGIWAVFGYSRDDFFVEKISAASGVHKHTAVAQNSGVMYWFDTDGNIMAYNGQGAVPVSDKLGWWTGINKIQHGGDHHFMWADGKLFMSLEAGAAESVVSRWCFIYDPVIKALTRYDKEITSMFCWDRLNTEDDPLFLFAQGAGVEHYNLYRYDRSYSTDNGSPDTIDDETGDPLLDTLLMELLDVNANSTSDNPITAYYRTAWITANETATKKRWKRPRVTAAAEGDTTIDMLVYHDYNYETSVKSSEIIIDADDQALWGTFLWGDIWGTGDDDYYSFTRQPSAGSGYSVQFRFSSVNNPGRWWVDSIAVPFRRKEVR